jgi:hypothetical protein
LARSKAKSGEIGLRLTGHDRVLEFVPLKRFVDTETGFDEIDFFKRFLTCAATCLMPVEGVNENLESTLDRLQFYLEEETLLSSRRAQQTPVTTTPAISGDVSVRPGLVLIDSQP